MATSIKRIEANRANALRSTGPRTAAGKAVAARNAVVHGLFARAAIIDRGEGREDSAEFDAVLRGLQDELRPAGQLEQLLVEKVAVNYWRLRRLLRFEASAVRDQIDRAIDNAVSNYRRRFWGRPEPEGPPTLKNFEYGDRIPNETVDRQVMLVARLTEGDWFSEQTAREAVLREWREQNDGTVRAGDRNAEAPPADVLERFRPAALEREKATLAEMEEVRSWRPVTEGLAGSNCFPSLDVAERLIKYEVALEKSVFRNLEALLHLQEARRRSLPDAQTIEPEVVTVEDPSEVNGSENGFVLEFFPVVGVEVLSSNSSASVYRRPQ